MLRYSCVVLLALTVEAQAGVYKCEMPDGVMAYQTMPCPATAIKAEETDIKLITKPKVTAAPATETAPTSEAQPENPEEEKSWLQRRIDEREAQKKQEQEQRELAQKEAEDKIRFAKLIKEHKIDVGMTREQVIQSWGMPSEGQRTQVDNSDGEILKYKNLKDLKGAKSAVVTLKEGRVVGFTKE